MKTIQTVLVAALVLFLPGWKVLGSGGGVNAVPRFQQVAEGLFRGGQPTGEGFQQLKDKGIRTIINLRVDDSERKVVESLGMKYIHIPVEMPLLTRPWKQIEAADIAAFLAAVDDPLNQPAFVHCRRGADRTGLMIGMYRISRHNWDGPRAYREARQIGMRWWFRAFKQQLLTFRAAQE